MAPGELRGNALYDIAVGTVRQLSDDAASGDMAWMPGATRVIYFAKSGKLVIQNIATVPDCSGHRDRPRGATPARSSATVASTLSHALASEAARARTPSAATR